MSHCSLPSRLHTLVAMGEDCKRYARRRSRTESELPPQKMQAFCEVGLDGATETPAPPAGAKAAAARSRFAGAAASCGPVASKFPGQPRSAPRARSRLAAPGRRPAAAYSACSCAHLQDATRVATRSTKNVSHYIARGYRELR